MKGTSYDEWIQPNQCESITHFFKESKNKVGFEDDNNKHSMLTENDENDDEKEYDVKEHERKLKRAKGNSEKGIKNQK